MKIWDGIELYNNDIGLFKSWIFTLSKYTAIDILRKEKKHSKSNIEIYENIKSEDTVEELVLLKCIINDMQSNIKNLNEIDKDILNQRYAKGIRIKDIAESLGITPKAISLRIMRIKNRIKNNS